MKRALALGMAILCFLAPCAKAEESAIPSFNWYEVFVSSYQDSDGDGIGDLQGLISRLDYIEYMGFDGLWLMPVMPSPSYHKYDVADYLNIDPAYGTLEDFKALAEGCHQRGIRLIIDLPVNHTSLEHPWFQAACEAIREGNMESPYIGYYNFSRKTGMKNIPVGDTGWYYEEQFSGGGMPDLNLDNPLVREEIAKIMKFWLVDMQADGFRLDAVTSYYGDNDVSQNVPFLSWLNSTAKEIKKDCFIVGEAWTGLTDIAAYYESGVDCFFLFPASQAEGYIARTIRARSKPAQQFLGYFEQMHEALGDHMPAPFLGNHDTGRAVGSLQARSAPEKAKFAHALISLLGGAAFTYYGDEIGMVGSGDDPNKRLAMYWNDGDMTLQPPGVTKLEYAFPGVDAQLEDENSLLHYVKNLNILKRENPSIALGKTEILYSDGDLLVFRRSWENEETCILVNFSAKNACEYECALENMTFAGALYAKDETAQVSVEEGKTRVILPHYGIVVLKKSI